MSSAVEINGTTLVPIKVAASRVKYSRDYVSRLAREGKIVASQVGRQWFVDLDSLERFATDASSFEEIRKQELRAERRRELMAKESLAALEAAVNERGLRQRFDAMVVTGAVTCLGLVVGLGVFTAQNFSEIAITQSVAVAPHAPAETVPESPFRVIVEPTDILVTSITTVPATLEEGTVEPMSVDRVEGIFLITDNSLDDEESVARIFSDPVEVSFAEGQSGVVRYDQGDGVVTEYPFIRIPAVDGESLMDTQP